MGIFDFGKKNNSEPIEDQPRPTYVHREVSVAERLRIASIPNSEPVSEADVLEYSSSDEPPLSNSNLTQRLEQRREELESLTSRLELIEQAMELRADSVQRIETSKTQAMEWLARVQSSFVWKLKASLGAERAIANQQLRQMEQDVASVKLPEKGVLAKLQSQFVSNFLKSWIVPLVTMLVVYLIPWSFTVPKIPELAALYDPATAGPVLAGVILFLLGLSALIVYLFNRDKFPTTKFLVWVAIIAIAGVLIYQLNFLEPWLRYELAPWLVKNFWNFLIFSVLLLFVSILSVLIFYYSKWSQFRREVDLQLTRMQNVVRGYVAVKQELKRLESLHQQAEDWLALLASAVHRPWKVDPRWLEEPNASYDLAHTPSALRIARAVDSGDSKTSALERTIGEKLLVRGWRKAAFEDMVGKIGAALGANPANFNVETLDGDLPHLPNNHRKIVAAFLQQTANNEADGTIDFSSPMADPDAPGGVRSTDKYMREIALDRIRALLRDAQMNAIRVQRPDVEPLGGNDNLRFDFDETGFDELQTKRSWDEFLSESLGTVDEAQPPLSPMIFTTRGKSQRLHEQVQSYLIAPTRIESTIPSVKTSKVKVVPSGVSKPRRVEVIARVDVSSPVTLDTLTLFSREDEKLAMEAKSAAANSTKTCSRCGYIDCAASSDPTAKCSESGRL